MRLWVLCALLMSILCSSIFAAPRQSDLEVRRKALNDLLAERWEVSPDGLTFRFHLRHGVKFQNGKEMTSADVVASLQRFAKISPERVVMAPVTGIEAEGPDTVAVKVNAPYPTFIDRLSSPASPCSIIPAEEATVCASVKSCLRSATSTKRAARSWANRCARSVTVSDPIISAS